MINMFIMFIIILLLWIDSWGICTDAYNDLKVRKYHTVYV